MTACCWPQEQGFTAHTLTCVMEMPDHLTLVPDPPDAPAPTAPDHAEET